MFLKCLKGRVSFRFVSLCFTMSDEKCVKIFKIGRRLGNLEGLRKRCFRQQLHSKTIKKYRTSDFTKRLLEEIYKVKTVLEIQDSVNLDKIEDKLIDMYDQLLCETMDMTDQLLEEETK